MLPRFGTSRLTAILVFLLWTAVFAIAYTQWPLYTGKQHTKFLHGIAASGFGDLERDWLVNTVDPLPVFSTLVWFTSSYLHENAFYLYQAVLLGIYLFAITAIAARITNLGRTTAGLFLFVVAMIALYSTLVLPFSYPLFGTSLGWLLQSGVAGQYLLNPSFEPGSFGVFLMLSIALYLHDRLRWAAFFAALAALFHSAYLLAAGLLVGIYVLTALWSTRKLREPVIVGLIALMVVLPELLYNYLLLGPTAPETWARAQEIIVRFRIPHHSLPELWLDSAAYARLAIVLIAIFLARKTRLLPILATLLLVIVSLTVAQMVTDSNALAFLAPWRLSVLIAPLSAVVVMAAILDWIFSRVPVLSSRLQPMVIVAGSIILAILVWRGGAAIQDSFARRALEPGQTLLQYVFSTREADDIYLVPASMAEFRLETGAPVLVTQKSHPYKDVEIIQWYDRLERAEDFYAHGDCTRLADLVADYAISHVVLGVEDEFEACTGTREIYRDDRYVLLRIEGTS